jgi:hypothetical protein
MTEMTSIQTVTDSLVTETLGGSFLGNFVALPADGTRGGIILACSKKKEHTLSQRPYRGLDLDSCIRSTRKHRKAQFPPGDQTNQANCTKLVIRVTGE